MRLLCYLVALLHLCDGRGTTHSTRYASVDVAQDIMDGVDNVIHHQLRAHALRDKAGAARNYADTAAQNAANQQRAAVHASASAQDATAMAVEATAAANQAVAENSHPNPYPAAVNHMAQRATTLATAYQQDAMAATNAARNQQSMAQMAAVGAAQAAGQAQQLSLHSASEDRSMTAVMQQQASHYGLENHVSKVGG